jgi:hypothetical protein
MSAGANYLDWRAKFQDLIAADGMYTIRQLDESLAQGHSQLWATNAAAIVTAITDYEGGERIGQVDWAVGDLDEILTRIMPEAEAYFTANRCTRIMFEGRTGWSRVLKDHGFRPHSVTLVKDIA